MNAKPITILLLCTAVTALHAQTQNLLPSGAELSKRTKATSGQVTISSGTGSGIDVSIAPGEEGYPGLDLLPDGAAWDLSKFGHVDAKITNTGEKPLTIAVRLDNKGDWKKSPWSTESVKIKPGESAVANVIFGHSYGKKPSYPLKPEEIINIRLFANRSSAQQSFRIESVQAAGLAGEKPPIDPKTIRIKPKNGLLFGSGVKIDPAQQITAKGAQAALEGDKLKIEFPAGSGEQTVTVKPEIGRWDLRETLQVTAKVKNTGNTPITPKIRVNSNEGSTVYGKASAPIQPNAEAEITVSYIPPTPWEAVKNSGEKPSYEGVPGTGTKFLSDAASGVTITAETDSAPRTLVVQSITANVPPTPEMPDWLGKRPPVTGDWTMTFEDEFDAPEIDQTKWVYYGANYWDKKSHWSKDNLILKDGKVTFRYEKKTGHHNDDPTQKQTDYVCGLLESYGKWVQRYGYFEARVKLPRASGLWPAFWLMPDRGAAVGPQWKRADTANGAMEFDIMEHLTRWGPYRYNIAMHWDGYQKAHKSTGTTRVYFQPDKDGFVTSGMLWTPGMVVFYAQGREVARWEDPRISNVQANMLLTVPQGGWDNSPIDDKQLPDDFVVDYVRVWQRKDLASNVDGYQGQATPAP